MSKLFIPLFVYASIFPFIGIPSFVFQADTQPIFLFLLIPAIISSLQLKANLFLKETFILTLVPLFVFPLLIVADGAYPSTLKVFATFFCSPLLLLFFSSLQPQIIYSVLYKSSIFIFSACLLQLGFGRNLFDNFLFRSIAVVGNGRGLSSLFPEPSFLVTQCTFVLCILTLILLFDPNLAANPKKRKHYLLSVSSLTLSVMLSMSVTSIFYFLVLFFAIGCVLPIFFPLKKARRLIRTYFILSISTVLLFCSYFLLFPSFLFTSTEGTSRLLDVLPHLLDFSFLLNSDLSIFTRVVSICSSTVYLMANPFHFSSSAYLTSDQLSFCEGLLSSNPLFYSLTDSSYNPLLFLSSTLGLFGLIVSVLLPILFILALRRRFNDANYLFPFEPVFLIGLMPFFMQTSSFNPTFWLFLSVPAFLSSKRRSFPFNQSAY